jgi:ribonuclease BN (tRNA processing enzyme)
MSIDSADLELSVIGAGPAWSDRPGSSGAAYLVRSLGTDVLLDLGHGSFTRLAQTIEPSALDAVVISHLHPDHFIDLVALRHYLRYEFDPPRRVRVLGPAGLCDRIDALHAEPGFTAETLEVESVGGPSSRSIGPFTLQSTLVLHTAESYGYRVSVAAAPERPGVVYSGDCGRADDLVPLIRPGDTLLTECSFGPGPVPPDAFHLDGTAVGRLASAQAAGAVLLTHVQMSHDRSLTLAAVRALYTGPVRFVAPGDRFTV